MRIECDGRLLARLMLGPRRETRADFPYSKSLGESRKSKYGNPMKPKTPKGVGMKAKTKLRLVRDKLEPRVEKVFGGKDFGVVLRRPSTPEQENSMIKMVGEKKNG